MHSFLDSILNWPIFKGHRSSICQVLLVALAGYQYAITHAILPAVISPDTIVSLMAVISAYAVKFAKEHQSNG